VQPLRAPTDWWDIVMGSGFRATVEQLDPDQHDRVRAANVAALVGVDTCTPGPSMPVP
jgi:hypothetical protein